MELVYTLAPMAATIIPFELPLPKILPTIEGNVDYRTLRDQLALQRHFVIRAVVKGGNAIYDGTPRRGPSDSSARDG